jgi:cardiolipin synthase A/B
VFMPARLLAETTVSTGFMVVAILAILAQSVILIVAFFGRGLGYKISSPNSQPLESPEFLYMLEALTDAKVNTHTKLQVFTNGENFYEAELDRIRNARKSVHLEAYIFQAGEIAKRVVAALTAKALEGVEVRVVLDGLGSLGMKSSYFKDLVNAGGKVEWYQSVKFSKLPHYNHRSHREVLICDGTVGFIGGAGIADHWFHGRKGKPRWRDTMVQVEGDAVPNLQATFAENWLEASGELLVGAEYFPLYEVGSGSAVLVIDSTPTAGGSTRARILFQILLASAKKSIHITTPYFLPDQSMSKELVRAVQRGVELKIITPGKHSDHMLTRSSSRRSYGGLLKVGARIFEYQSAMIHAKILTIDGLWSVVGSTNFDNRSFGLNDEVNLAACDPKFAARLDEDFARDLAESREVTYAEWRTRSFFERGPELLGWILERQQ